MLRIKSIILFSALFLILISCAEQTAEPSKTVPAPEPSSVTYAQTESAADPAEPAAGTDTDALFIENLIDSMSLEQQVSQLFIISLPGGLNLTDLSDFITESGAGGYILFKENITTIDGTKALTDAISAVSAIAPFICIDEEGGKVSRLHGMPGYTPQPTAKAIGESGDPNAAFAAGETIGRALVSVGVNVDFAPVADILTANPAIDGRAYGTDPETVSEMAAAFQAGLHSQGIMSAPKHFPGHGGAIGDSHDGSAILNRSAEELAETEYLPFIRAIEDGAEFIMTGHLIVPSADTSELPATLSKYFVTDILRQKLDFNGIIITDAMNMGAIMNRYDAAEAAVMAVEAGIDMILMPADFYEAAAGIIAAVEEEKLSRKRIRESLERILRIKLEAGLVSMR